MTQPPLPTGDPDHDPAEIQSALEELARATLALGIRSRWELANRRGLLWAHALWGIWVGVQIVLYGGPGNIERTFGVWTRPFLGLLAITGGVLLASGLAARPRRNIPREIWGLIVVGLWDAAMFGGIVASRVGQGAYSPRALLDPQPVGYVVAYPTGVYGLLATLIIIHLLTLVRLSETMSARWVRLQQRIATWTRPRSPRGPH